MSSKDFGMAPVRSTRVTEAEAMTVVQWIGWLAREVK